MIDEQLRKVIEGIANTYGDEFFIAITGHLHDIIGADYTFVARLDLDSYQASTIALIAKGQRADNFTYSLLNTPCANVAENTVCFYPRQVCNVFPDDQLLLDMRIEAYIGTPLLNAAGTVIGLIVGLYEKEVPDGGQTKMLFQLLSGRIAAELQRYDYEQRLLLLNNALEEKVSARTAELERTLNHLQQTQHKLIESKKMASLGVLVSGVAHEINTPLGIAITAVSSISEELRILGKAISQRQLTVEQLRLFHQSSTELTALMERNLLRAGELVENFKKSSADQHSDEFGAVRLKAYYLLVISTLKSFLKSHNVKVEIDADDALTFATFPGVHAQILTNLIMNSIQHAFGQTPEPLIQIRLRMDANGLDFLYVDNGCGVADMIKPQIFEPFVTTNRSGGATGLGLFTVFNLVTQKLQGQLELNTGAGFALRILMPNLAQSSMCRADG